MKNKITNNCNKDLQNKIIFTITILVFIQFISNIPLFGIDREVLKSFMNSDIKDAFSLFNLFSGNALSQMSIFVIGITPYISASIIMQLLKVIIPRLEEIYKDGKIGEDKYKKITYIVAGILAIIQSIPIAYSFSSYGLLVKDNYFYISIVSIQLILGSILLIYLSSIIDKKGIGKGMSLILLINILSRFPSDINTIYETFCKGKGLGNLILTIFTCIVVISITIIGIIYLQNGEKRIKTQYSSQIKGIKSLNGEADNYLPLKINIAGVMPIIFTTSLFQMYILGITLFKVDNNSILYKVSEILKSTNWFQVETPIYNLGFILQCVLIFMFSSFYTTMVFDSQEVANNLRKTYGVIVGIRPGKDTVNYLDKKIKSLRMIGAIVLILVVTFPMLITSIFNIKEIAFGGTSIIIVVGCILETYKSIESEKLENNLSSFLF